MIRGGVRANRTTSEDNMSRCVTAAVTGLLVTLSAARADDAVIAVRTLAPDAALDLARASLESCRRSGYQVAVAVVDRFGVVQVVLRDRFAGPHTVPTAIGKAWTAASLRTSTLDLVQITQPGQPQAGMRNLPGVVAVGGGLPVEAAGSIVGGIGVSGAPGGEADQGCAAAALEAMRDRLDF